MAIGDDFTIDYVNKRIRHSTTATTVWTVNALYSYLQDTFDDIAQMDDPIPMSAQTPTEYTLINGWFMNEARENEGGANYRNCFEYLKNGAIQTSGQNGVVRMLTLSATGYTSAVAGDIGKTVTGATSGDTGLLLDYNNTSRKWWVRQDTSNDTFANTTEGLSIAGSGTGAGAMGGAASTTGEQLWTNIYTLGTIEQHTNEEQIYIEQNSSRIFSGAEWWPENAANATTRHIDVLLKIKEASSEINSGNITVYLRNYPTAGFADLYDHFGIDLSSGGRNAVPLATSPDLNNTNTHATVSAYSGIDIAFVNGYIAANITGSFSEFESVTQAGSGAYGVFIEQTTSAGAGSITLGNVVGTFNNTNIISGATASAAASASFTDSYRIGKAFSQQTENDYSVIIDCDSKTLASVYQYLKYVTRIGSTYTMYPTTTALAGTISHTTKQGQLYIRAHEDNQAAPTNTFSPVKASPFGTFAGGTFFGAQGVWIQTMHADDVKKYQLIDSNGNTQQPPNQVPISITNLLSGDRISVFRTVSATDSSILKTMFTSAANNTASSTTFVISASIPPETPNSGYIRTVDTSDTTATREQRYTYSSWTGSTFTLSSGTLGKAYEQTTDTAYVPFIDTEVTTTFATVTVVYTTQDRAIITRVRRKTSTAILPFEVTGTFGSGGYTTAAIRTTDTIVN